MKIIEMRLREIGFVLWGHCQNLLDDPRKAVIWVWFLLHKNAGNSALCSLLLQWFV